MENCMEVTEILLFPPIFIDDRYFLLKIKLVLNKYTCRNYYCFVQARQFFFIFQIEFSLTDPKFPDFLVRF